MKLTKSLNKSMISKANYNDLKEYWDYQRLLEYNREKVWIDAEKFSDDEDPAEAIFEILWNKIDPDDFETPPTDWVPKNIDFRIEGESYVERDIKGFSTSQI